jgi:predicted MFS family arabinose efflux permease
LASRLVLLLVFAALYFVQGLGEPGDGLLAQPLRGLFERDGHGAGAIAGSMFLVALPWSFKPLYGLWFDHVPLLGERRRSWLVACAGAGLCALLALVLAGPGPGPALYLGLAAVTLAIACGDVLIDALMVEVGQARGLTGQIQSVQWTAIYGASILAGALGGRLTADGGLRVAYLVCAAGAALTLALALAAIREPKVSEAPGPSGQVPGDMSRGTGARLREGLRELAAAARTPALRVAAVFLCLWSFVPFYGTVLDVHVTGALGVAEADHGDALALHAVACMLASAAYGLYCRRVALPTLVAASVALGALAALVYAAVDDVATLRAAQVAAGLAYMTGSIIQLDLAARVCPPRIAGSTFALLMAAQNLCSTLAVWIGGHAYEALAARWGAGAAFDALVLAGAAITASCGLLVPALRRALA